ncbi:MAG: GatB/YqeY domain-containing protein [Calditrichaeota bacterium]|nr:MAG: GatB/YqeY domain-containing protein [Calditrichota bacterium]
MGLEKRLMDDMKEALKAGDKLRLETIRSLRAQIKNAQIAAGKELSEEELIQVLMSAAKKRKESIEQFKAVGREDRAEEESRELEIIESYLPKQMTAEEIQALVEQVITEVGASSPKDLGKVMGAIMPRVKGKADGKLVQQIVREKLNSL